MIQYRELCPQEVCTELFHSFARRQKVTKCWRKEKNGWVIKDDPFIDDWTEKEYQALLAELKSTLLAGGCVYAAFCGGHLKGFVSVKPDLMDEKQTYLDLTNIHVSEEMRGQGIGKRLFLAAKEWAKKKGAKKLYLSAHSAVETQAFYKSMGCTEAEIYSQIHVEQEPFDCQLECRL